jgi:hypothetical protein
MRLWSLHPEYLDARGLVALWREGLLARRVLTGKTKGYRNHPQMRRFKTSYDPLLAIDSYLSIVLEEASRRGYKFDASKIKNDSSTRIMITVTDRQIAYEFVHLKRKLKKRDQAAYLSLQRIDVPRPHPLFSVVEGSIEDWEKPRVS